ncbi:hypothetical protein BpHYR1_012870 [Brachionus plicatilis]|uniref:Uncharacterized protein n=1 Tax=Brachionus plicatilis TaxID=10195 RepID=A0A3M7RZB0_BRAPC|nr:hypothetical protein BpHYR1_012870 [Brachionus plicatilis]
MNDVKKLQNALSNVSTYTTLDCLLHHLDLIYLFNRFILMLHLIIILYKRCFKVRDSFPLREGK